jgi:hypothetical protein
MPFPAAFSCCLLRLVNRLEKKGAPFETMVMVDDKFMKGGVK